MHYGTSFTRQRHDHVRDQSSNTAIASFGREVAGINLVLGGHNHMPITYLENGVLIHKAGFDAYYLAVVELEVTKGRDAKGAETLAMNTVMAHDLYLRRGR